MLPANELLCKERIHRDKTMEMPILFKALNDITAVQRQNFIRVLMQMQNFSELGNQVLIVVLENLLIP